jgi:hypothetical protein
MNCTCGKEASIYSRSRNQCWDCFSRVFRAGAAIERTPLVAATGSIHIDRAWPREQLCNGAQGSWVLNMTPAIAAAMVSQHPNKQVELCPDCLAALRRDYVAICAEALAFAANLQKKALRDLN